MLQKRARHDDPDPADAGAVLKLEGELARVAARFGGAVDPELVELVVRGLLGVATEVERDRLDRAAAAAQPTLEETKREAVRAVDEGGGNPLYTAALLGDVNENFYPANVEHVADVLASRGKGRGEGVGTNAIVERLADRAGIAVSKRRNRRR